METWRDIAGYEGLYQVSSYGRLRGLERLDCRGNKLEGRVLKPRKINSGYLLVHLRDSNGIRAGKLVHRLVEEAFIDNSGGKPQVDHIDEDKTNNHVENLRWVTPKENTNHGTGIERAAIGRSVPVVMLDERGNEVKTYMSATAAARELGIQQGSITNCCKGKHRHAGGYRWRYA